jgi:hypothetical protein
MTAAVAPAASPRVAFWRDVRAKDGKVADGADVAALAVELATTLLRSPDPKLRDGVATDVLEFWIRRDGRLDAAALRTLTARLYEGLRVGVGQAGDDSVYGRTFSALVLSMVAARDVAAPFMTDAELSSMVTNAAWYASSEVDLRGHDARGGWAHAAAHTADWLRWLAAHPALGAPRSQAVLDAVVALTVRRHGTIFAYGEDGRLAQTVLQLWKSSTLDAAAMDAMTSDFFTKLFAPLLEAPGPEFDAAQFAAQRNARNLLFTLFVQLSLGESSTPHATSALATLRALLAG